jgi:hypothetical protein
VLKRTGWLASVPPQPAGECLLPTPLPTIGPVYGADGRCPLAGIHFLGRAALALPILMWKNTTGTRSSPLTKLGVQPNRVALCRCITRDLIRKFRGKHLNVDAFYLSFERAFLFVQPNGMMRGRPPKARRWCWPNP